MIDWKEAAHLIRKRYRHRSEWWREGWVGWRESATYWMRRADAAEKRVRELEAVLRSLQHKAEALEALAARPRAEAGGEPLAPPAAPGHGGGEG